MIKKCLRMALCVLSLVIVIVFVSISSDKGQIKGIYVAQYKFKNAALHNYLINHAKSAGIDTLIVDLGSPSKQYNVDSLKDNNIKHMARSTKGHIKGIYVTQYNFENTAFLNYLIKHAKAAGIDTFVVDFEKPSKRYKDNIELLKDNNIKYVSRIVMFPGGGTREQVGNPAIWQKKIYPG